MDWMRICPAKSGFLVDIDLDHATAPLASRTAFSRSGPSCLHGPHHGAQKIGTMTGTEREPSTTIRHEAGAIAVLHQISAGASAISLGRARADDRVHSLPSRKHSARKLFADLAPVQPQSRDPTPQLSPPKPRNGSVGGREILGNSGHGRNPRQGIWVCLGQQSSRGS
jgi:hypothetical protein